MGINVNVERQKLAAEYAEKLAAIKDPDAPSKAWPLCAACGSFGRLPDRNGNPGRELCPTCGGIGRVKPEPAKVEAPPAPSSRERRRPEE